MFTSASAYQFRLRGPNKWEGAREAILEQDARMRYPMRRPAIEVEERQGGKGKAKAQCGQCKMCGGSFGGLVMMLMLFAALLAVFVAVYRPEVAQSALAWIKSNVCHGAVTTALKWAGLR